MTVEQPELEAEVSVETKNPKPTGKLKYFWNDCVARRNSSITNQCKYADINIYILFSISPPTTLTD